MEFQSTLYHKDVIAIDDLTKQQIMQTLAVAALIENHLEQGNKLRLLQGYILVTLFSEPSTRTRLSFESAMHRLGGAVVSTADGKNSSSEVKGETIADTARTVNSYGDVIAMRHSKRGSAQEMAKHTSKPVINAGDGSGEHPTQALLDLYTIQKERGTIDGLHIVLVGDLKHGRTTHSLLEALRFWKVRVTLVSPEALRMPADLVERARAAGLQIIETDTIEGACADAHVVYMTRVQKERFANPQEYEDLKDCFIVDEDFMKRYPDVTLLHPLPRVDEITPGVDEYENAAYFRQAQNGLYVRAALLLLTLLEEVEV